jgi:type IV secretion system protein TrbI
MADTAPETAQVTDHRPRPRGVLPRHAQTWLMVGLAVGMLGIIVFAGRPEPPSRPAPAPSSAAAQTPDPGRLRDYGDRLRVLDTRARQETLAQASQPSVPPAMYQALPPDPNAIPTPSPLETERERREYESLFATNLVFSRRPEGQRFAADATGFTQRSASGVAPVAAPPTLDEVAAAVVRATTQPPPSAPGSVDGPRPASPEQIRTPGTGPINQTGPLHRVLEGTVIDAVLTNRLDGNAASPVVCLVTNPVYSHHGQHTLIPAGARVIGTSTPVQSVGETRLAVAFHRLLMPDGSSHSLDQFTGMNQVGDTGLRDQVNQRYWSTFGASGAVGLINGLAQLVGTAGLTRGSGDRTVVIAGGVGDATSQATMQVMNRFLNRLPQITIREGHRVKVYLTDDIELPAYEPSAQPVASVVH